MLDRVDKILAVAVLSKVFHREPVARPYAAAAFRLCLAALELQRPAQKNAFRHLKGVLLVCETAGAELPDLVGVIAFCIVLPAIFSADFQRHILHCCCRRKARAFPHVPAGRCYRGKLCGKVCPCPCADYCFSPFKDNIIVCRCYLCLYMDSVSLAVDCLSVFSRQVHYVAIVREIFLLDIIVFRAELLHVGIQIVSLHYIPDYACRCLVLKRCASCSLV